MTWNTVMFKYFKVQWEEKWKIDCPEMEDVYDEVNGIAQSMTENVLAGIAQSMTVL